MQQVTRLAARRLARRRPRSGPSLGSLLTLVVSVAAYDYLTGLLARYPLLGMVALALTALLALLVLVQVDPRALGVPPPRPHRRLPRRGGRGRTPPPTARPRSRLAAPAGRLLRRPRRSCAGTASGWPSSEDGGPRRRRAPRARRAQPARAARRPGAARDRGGEPYRRRPPPRIVPLALIDVLTALSQNVRMVRRIAEVYGAHAGFFGSWRLLRMVATHLLATGAVAVGDDLIGSVAGGHVLAPHLAPLRRGRRQRRADRAGRDRGDGRLPPAALRGAAAAEGLERHRPVADRALRKKLIEGRPGRRYISRPHGSGSRHHPNYRPGALILRAAGSRRVRAFPFPPLTDRRR